MGDAAEQLGGGLDDRAALAHEVPRAQDREGVVGERRRHARTVRSAARARNRTRGRLALLLIAILGALLALTARAGTAAERVGAGELLASDGAAPLDGDGDGDGRGDGDGDGRDGSGGGALTDGRSSQGGPHGEELDGDALEVALGLGGLGGLGDLEGLDDLALDDLDGLAQGGLAQGGLAQGGLAQGGLDDAAAESSKALPLGAEAARGADLADLADPAAQLYEELRRRRPWWWSRLDLTIAWRRAISGEVAKDASRRGELWLLATWSR